MRSEVWFVGLICALRGDVGVPDSSPQAGAPSSPGSSHRQPVQRGGSPTSSTQLASVLLGPGHQLLLQMFFPGLESPGVFTHMSWLQSHRPVLASQRRGRLRCAGCSGPHRRLSIALPLPGGALAARPSVRALERPGCTPLAGHALSAGATSSLVHSRTIYHGFF